MGLPATRISGRRMPSLPWLVYLTEQLSARADRDVAGGPVNGGGDTQGPGRVEPPGKSLRQSPGPAEEVPSS